MKRRNAQRAHGELTEHHGWNREQQQHKGNIAAQMIPKACFTVKQTRTKERASLTDVDVIVFVNNTQLDAVDQLRLLKASPCTQRTKTSTAIHHITLFLQSPLSRCARRSCGVDAAATK